MRRKDHSKKDVQVNSRYDDAEYALIADVAEHYGYHSPADLQRQATLEKVRHLRRR